MFGSILKLIRWPNILVILFSLLFIRFMVILPALGLDANDGMNLFNFVLLSLSMVSITVGGYLINNLEDADADEINKPGRNPVGRVFSEQSVRIAYYIVNLVGIAAATWVAIDFHKPLYSLISVFTIGLLWFYSKRYKCQPLLGNFVVAFLSAFSFGLVWLFDFLAIARDQAFIRSLGERFLTANYLVLIYMGFAFVVSLAREVVKDMEDYDGDNRFGCRTFTVVYGISPSKIFVTATLATGFLFSGFVQYYFYRHGFMSLYYFFYVIDVLFVVNTRRLIKAEGKSDFSMLSAHLKVLMGAGIISMILCFIDLSYAA